MPNADFSTWERANLEQFARQAADENLQLRERVAHLEADLRTALDAWRGQVPAAPSWIGNSAPGVTQ